MDKRVDVVPFCARVLPDEAGGYEIWWDDPRDVQQVEVTFATPLAEDALPKLYYWQHSWPRVRLAKNEVVGAGAQGWLPMDDWITGQWRRAATTVSGSGTRWTYAFELLDAEDVPDAQAFPVTFRRTLKILLGDATSTCAVEKVAVYTDSEWREVEVCLEWGGHTSRPQIWDGCLEAFNGYVLGVQALVGDCEVQSDGSWRSRVCGDTAGVRARVRYAWNEDRNSFDRTILTLRSTTQASFSVDLNDVAGGEEVYLPDYGVVVAAAEGYRGLRAIRAGYEARRSKTTYERVLELPEQTWERAWGDMPQKGRWYFVLGVEGGRQKYRLEPNGDLWLMENKIRKVRGRDTERLQWAGETLVFGFGLPAPSQRQLVGDYLPILRTDWVTRPIAMQQEAFATWLLADMAADTDKQGDDPVVALLRFTLMNVGSGPEVARLPLQTADGAGQERLETEAGRVYALHPDGRRLRCAVDLGGKGTLRAQDGGVAYEVALLPGEQHAIVVKVPFVTLHDAEELRALGGLDYAEQRDKVISFWERRVAAGMQISVPNYELNRFHKAHLIHMLIINDREPGSDRLVPRCGGFHYGNYPDEGIMCTSDLDRRGYTHEAERCLEIMIHYQGTVPLPGDFETQFGVLYGSNGYEDGGYNRGQGWAMWGMAEHYRYTRDKAWLERVAPALVRSCDWIIQERRRTMVLGANGKRPIEYGFLPAGSLEDVTDYWHWLSSNAYASWGFTAIAEVLADIGHPEAPRLQQEAAAFRSDLMAGFNEAQARSPVIKLADGRYVPYYPARLERRGRDFGWLREVLEGSMGLLVSELVPWHDSAARWIVEDYEDNLYTSERFGYANSIPDYERYWFSRGGFSMQSNLLLHPAVYLRRDDVKPFLRACFNGFASTYYPETCMCAEHALPTLADARGDHFKTSDEANVAHYLRLLLIEEHGKTLLLGKAIPRAWLEDGKEVKVERALTYFGPMGYSIRSHANEGYIEADVDLPMRNAPASALLRLRHPRQKTLRSVEIDGQPWTGFDPASETITLPVRPGMLKVRAQYCQ
ncbi:MAG: hypothetical protein ACUVX9_14655 [Anaerolineae bacterium]